MNWSYSFYCFIFTTSAHFALIGFQATRSANVSIPAHAQTSSNEQPWISRLWDQPSSFHQSFYGHLSSLTATSDSSKTAPLLQSAAEPLLNDTFPSESSSDETPSEQNTQFVRMHKISPRSASTTPTSTLSAGSTSNNFFSIFSTTKPEYPAQHVSVCLTCIPSGRIMSNLVEGVEKQYGLDIRFIETRIDRQKKIPSQNIQEILKADIYGSAPNDWSITGKNNHLIIDYREKLNSFETYYHILSYENLEKQAQMATTSPYCHRDIIAISATGVHNRIVATCHNKIIKVFDTNPIQLAYSFKCASTITPSSKQPITVAVSKKYIIVGILSNLEFYEETENGKDVHFTMQCTLSYKDKTFTKPVIKALAVSEHNNDDLVGIMTMKPDPESPSEHFFFALTISDLLESKNKQTLSCAIVHLPRQFSPKIGTAPTILDRGDDSFLVSMDNLDSNKDSNREQQPFSEQLRFRKNLQSKLSPNPYCTLDTISRLLISPNAVLQIFARAYQKVTAPENYLIFRQIPYASSSQILANKISSSLSFLPKEILALIINYAWHYKSTYECFHNNQRIPLVSLADEKFALLFQGKLLLIDQPQPRSKRISQSTNSSIRSKT